MVLVSVLWLLSFLTRLTSECVDEISCPLSIRLPPTASEVLRRPPTGMPTIVQPKVGSHPELVSAVLFLPSTTSSRNSHYCVLLVLFFFFLHTFVLLQFVCRLPTCIRTTLLLVGGNISILKQHLKERPNADQGTYPTPPFRPYHRHSRQNPPPSSSFLRCHNPSVKPLSRATAKMSPSAANSAPVDKRDEEFEPANPGTTVTYPNRLIAPLVAY